MVFQAKIVAVKGLVLAVAILLWGQGSKVQAGCGDHVELGGVVASSTPSTDHAPAKGRPCSGPQCSKKSNGMPGVPLEINKRWVEKTDLASLFEWKESAAGDLIALSGLVVFSSPGHPLGVFHPPRI